MKKRVLMMFMAIILLVNSSAVMASSTTNKEYTCGDYTYTLRNNKAIITKYKGKDKVVNIPRTLDGYNVVEIGDYAFGNCTKITEVTVPWGVVKIRRLAFWECKNMKKIKLSGTVTYIGDGAFMECNSLESIKICSKATYIGEYAFCECYNLKKITIPKNVRVIREGTFSMCSSLVYVNIPVSVKQIRKNAFEFCPKLKRIYYSGSKTKWDSIACNDSTVKKLGIYYDGKRQATKITKISLSAPSKTVKAGKSITVTAKISPVKATYQTLTWKSSNTNYATVNANGKVTAKKAGKGHTVTITATSKDTGRKKATIKLTIK